MWLPKTSLIITKFSCSLSQSLPIWSALCLSPISPCSLCMKATLHTNIILYYKAFFIFLVIWHAGSEVPSQESNLQPLQWEQRVLTNGLPGMCQDKNFNSWVLWKLNILQIKESLSYPFINVLLKLSTPHWNFIWFSSEPFSGPENCVMSNLFI